MLHVATAPGFFRIVLAVAVIVSHLTRFDIGRLAVLLFFYLSGYWVSRIWIEEFGGRAPLRFYQSRALRIMPLFLITLLLAAALRQQPISPASLLLFGIATTKADPTGVAWSLDIELQFYLLVPLILPLLLSGERRTTALIAMFASLVVAGIAWWTADLHNVVTVAQFLPAFMLGALTYSTRWQPSARAAAASLTAFCLLTAAFAVLPLTSSFLDKHVADPLPGDVFGFIWMVPLLPYVAWSLTNRSNKFDRHLGNLSYPLYLVHFALIAVVVPVGGLQKLGAFAASVVLALAVYILLDRPLDRLRRWILARESIPAPPQPRHSATIAEP